MDNLALLGGKPVIREQLPTIEADKPREFEGRALKMIDWVKE